VNLQCINVSVSLSSDGLCYPCFPNDDTPLKGLWHTSAVAVGRTANHPASSLRVGNEATKSIWRAAQSRTRVMTWRDVAWFKGWPFNRPFHRNNLEYLRVAVWGAVLHVTARDTLILCALHFSCILERMVEVTLPLFLIIHLLRRCLVVLVNLGLDGGPSPTSLLNRLTHRGEAFRKKWRRTNLRPSREFNPS